MLSFNIFTSTIDVLLFEITPTLFFLSKTKTLIGVSVCADVYPEEKKKRKTMSKTSCVFFNVSLFYFLFSSKVVEAIGLIKHGMRV